jgi:hypothetical protein
VFAFYDIIWQTARLASIGLGGWLVDTAGIRSVYLAGGLLLLVAGTIGLATPVVQRKPCLPGGAM